MAPVKATKKAATKKSQMVKGVKATIKRACTSCDQPTLIGYPQNERQPFDLTHEKLKCKCKKITTPKRKADLKKVLFFLV